MERWEGSVRVRMEGWRRNFREEREGSGGGGGERKGKESEEERKSE